MPAVTIVKNEPYRLAREVWGIGFKTADKIARALGYGIDDPARIMAGTLFVLSEASDSGGHTYLPATILAEKAAEILEVSTDQVNEAIRSLAVDKGAQIETLLHDVDGSATFVPWEPTYKHNSDIRAVLHFSATKSAQARSLVDLELRPKVIEDSHLSTPSTLPAAETLTKMPGEQVVYLPPFYYAEQGIARHLARLAGCPPEKDSLAEFRLGNIESLLSILAGDDNKLVLATRQKEGVGLALQQPVAVLTGGPGTGKTTSMRALIQLLKARKKRVILAAPTGRAAKRLSEATGLEAKTLHRLLQLKPGGKSLYDHQDNPLPADMVILDETSMLDTLLMNSLLKGIATGTHLLLVGDADQLPSVGAGNVLRDIIDSGMIPVVKLDHIFRQGAGSAIVTNAHRINGGQMPITGQDITDFFFFMEDDQEKAADLLVELVSQRIPKKFGVSHADIQVLSPMHRGKCGVGYLNEKLQEVLNPASESRPQKQYGSKLFRVGDKVLQLKNNYQKDVYNGDSGNIVALSPEDQTITVRLEDDREVVYDFAELDELSLAFALSIHKSQGSEYPICVIPVVMGHYMLLERKLIYTAVTRARKIVVLVGTKKALAMAVRNGPGEELSGGGNTSSRHRAGRFTGLDTRLRAAFH